MVESSKYPYFQLSADLTGWAASSLLVGCMVGAAVAGPLGDRFGRKWSLILCAALFAVSSVASALPATLEQFAWSRFAGGIAIGAASMLSPLYIAEISPERFRGTLVALYQLAIVVGILVVFFVNLQIQRLGDEAWNADTGWRWMFASLTLPSILFGVLMLLVPESPRWLMKMGRRSEAQGDPGARGRRRPAPSGKSARSRMPCARKRGDGRSCSRPAIGGPGDRHPAGGVRTAQRDQRHHVLRARSVQGRRLRRPIRPSSKR